MPHPHALDRRGKTRRVLFRGTLAADSGADCLRAVDLQEPASDSVLNGSLPFPFARRREHPALRSGDIRFVDTPETTLAFVREDGRGSASWLRSTSPIPVSTPAFTQLHSRSPERSWLHRASTRTRLSGPHDAFSRSESVTAGWRRARQMLRTSETAPSKIRRARLPPSRSFRNCSICDAKSGRPPIITESACPSCPSIRNLRIKPPRLNLLLTSIPGPPESADGLRSKTKWPLVKPQSGLSETSSPSPANLPRSLCHTLTYFLTD